jgi:hypothetical protein
MTRNTFVLSMLLGLILVACNRADTPVTSQPGDPQPMPTSTGDLGDMQEGPVFIDSSDLLIMESYPVQINLHLVGNLPTPCHQFQADVAAPDPQNQIHVRVYSLVNPAVMCTQVLQPFDESVSIPMTGAADSTYSVWVNGELIGEFTYPG